MSVTVNDDGVTLIGDGFGENAARIRLPAAPVNARRMDFVFRAGFLDLPDASAYRLWTAQGWDACSFFGLGFDDTIYEFAADTITPTNFLGVMARAKPQSAGPIYDNDSKGFQNYNTGGGYRWAAPWGQLSASVNQHSSRMDGNGVELDAVTTISPNGNPYELQTFANDADELALVTYVWRVWGSALDKTVYMQWVKDRSGAAEGAAMFALMDTKTEGTGNGNILKNTVHADVTSNWRNADGTMNFPRWLKLKCVLPEYSFRLKYFGRKFYDLNDDEILT